MVRIFGFAMRLHALSLPLAPRLRAELNRLSGQRWWWGRWGVGLMLRKKYRNNYDKCYVQSLPRTPTFSPLAILIFSPQETSCNVKRSAVVSGKLIIKIVVNRNQSNPCNAQ